MLGDVWSNIRFGVSMGVVFGGWIRNYYVK